MEYGTSREGNNLRIRSVLMMARKKTYSKRKQTEKLGKAFKKKTSGGKFRKGTLIQYKYVNGRRVGAVKARRK